MVPFSDAFEIGKDTRNVAGWSFIGFVALQISINIVVKGYQIWLPIKKFISSISASAVKIIQ